MSSALHKDDPGKMTWTPEAYLKIMRVDAEQLVAEIEQGLAQDFDDRSYQIGQVARMVGKLGDNLALLTRAWRETDRSRT